MKNAWTIRLTLVAVLAAIFGAYANSFENGFHFDDFHTVVDNPAIRSLRNVPRFFTDASSFSVLPANRTYRPMVSASLALDYAMGGGYRAIWFHVGTFGLFLGLVVVLFLLYRTMVDRVRPGPVNAWVALFGAAWFGLHPAMAETINYVIQRGDLYCTLGCVGALYVFARWPRLRWMGWYLLPLGFALLSKPPAAVFPVLLLLYVFLFEGLGWRRSLIAAAPSALVTGGLLWLQSAMTPKTFLPSIISPWDYRLTQPYVWLRYFGALFLPVHLNVDTDLAPLHGFSGEAAAGLVFLAVLVGVGVYAARRRVLAPVAFGVAWFVVTQMPTSLYPLSEVENDHRMFFSFVGLVLAVVWGAWLGVGRLLSEKRLVGLRPLFAGLGVLVLIGYGVGVHARNAVWHDEESLWRDDVAKSPRNGRGLMIYGLTRMQKGAYADALGCFERALALTPNYATLEINLGVVNGAMADLGDAARGVEAERHFLRAVALQPNDDTTHAYYGRWLGEHGRSGDALAEIQRAIAVNPERLFQRDLLVQEYGREGEVEAARRAAEETLAIAPDDVVAREMLARPAGGSVGYWVGVSLVQYQQGKFGKAMDAARRALALDMHSAEAWNNLGAAQAGLGQWTDAVASEREALRVNPQLQIAKNNLAAYEGRLQAGPQRETVEALVDESMRLHRSGDYAASLAAAQKALRLNARSAEAWNNIAANDEALHRWDDAIRAAQKALELKPDFQLARNNLAWSMAQKRLTTE